MARLCRQAGNFTVSISGPVVRPCPTSDLSWSRFASISANRKARMERLAASKFFNQDALQRDA
jgi:hypothetical protein